MQKVDNDKKRIEEIFDRGIVSEILPSKESFFEKLLSGEVLKIYIGADPTSDALHLSHAKNFIFLEELRQLGHQVTILFGDFTAQIGDPSGISQARQQLSKDQVKANAESWLDQIRPLMDFDDKFNPPKIVYNSQWLSGLTMEEVVNLASEFTVQQMLERDMFQQRLKASSPIFLHEFLYPLMQGYDSVVMEVDVELCGTDQIFNALVGRTLLKRLKNKDKFIVALNLMENPKTKEIMSKSKKNGVFLNTSPSEMFGSIMAQPDEMIDPLFINNTRIPLTSKKEVLNLGSRNAKAFIAHDIVKRFFGEKKAKLAEQDFDKAFKKGAFPQEIKEFRIPSHPISIIELISGLNTGSRSEIKRLIDSGAVDIDGKTVNDWRKIIDIDRPFVLKVGAHQFFKIIKE